jgi:ABC-type sulfate/molybdate transport systems ATPase subunit
VLNDLPLEINESRVLISDSNGSGKTTLLMLAAGLITSDVGKVSFNQQSVLMTIMLGIMFNGVKHEAQNYVAGFLSFCAALLVASSLFDSQALLHLYQPYFTSLSISRSELQIHCLLYVAVKALPG